MGKYLPNVPDEVMINFAKEHTNDIKAYKKTEENENDFYYELKKVGEYKVCRVKHGSLKARQCARFIFRDYTCYVHGSVVPTTLDLSREWREEMIKHLPNKTRYVKEFNSALDKELEDLKEDYDFTRASLEERRLSLTKSLEAEDDNSEM